MINGVLLLFTRLKPTKRLHKYFVFGLPNVSTLSSLLILVPFLPNPSLCS